MDVSTYEATGSKVGNVQDLKSRTRVADSGSRIAFGVNEDLGGGLVAGLYCETGINIDNGSAMGQTDTGNANTSEWCSREGRASFGNKTAEVRLGRQNVFWTQGELNQVGSTFLGSDTATNLITGGTGVYSVRAENQIKVVAGSATGAFAGSEIYTGNMGISGSGSASNVTNPNGEAATADKGNSARYFGGKLQYSAGQYVAMWDFQNSTDAAAIDAVTGTAQTTKGVVGANSFSRNANKLGVGFKYTPTSIVTLQYWAKNRTDKTNGAAAFVSPFSTANNVANVNSAGSASDSGYAIVVKHDLGGGLMAHGQYTKANDLKSAGATQADTGATAYTLGLTKSMSKRTHFYTAYHKINNEANAAYNMTGGTYQSGTSRTGADVKVMSLGMIHNF